MGLSTFEKFDAIVIGAGHNGLILSNYLQRNGLSTVVLESESHAGGQMAVDESSVPGFAFYSHANYFNYGDESPWRTDLGIDVRSVQPGVQHGIAFSDGRPGIVIHDESSLTLTMESVGRYSIHDAKLVAELLQRAQRLRSAMLQVMFALPTSVTFERYRYKVEREFRGLGSFAHPGNRSAVDLIDDNIESPEVRTLLTLLAVEFGPSPVAEGSGLGFVSAVLPMIGNRVLPSTGMQAVVDALVSAATRVGVQVECGSPVDEILIEGGRASGVRLADGRTIIARRVVASTIGVRRTFAAVGQAQGVSRLERYSRNPAPHLLSQHFALTMSPRYSSARYEPHLDRAAQVFVGFDGPADVRRHVESLALGLLPEPVGGVTINAPHVAQPGRADTISATFHSTFPAGSTERDVDEELREAFLEALLSTWSQYAPNVGRAAVIGAAFPPLKQLDRGVEFGAGDESYRTGIGGLYLAGATSYPGGGVHGACAYNAAQVISADLNEGSDSSGFRKELHT